MLSYLEFDDGQWARIAANWSAWWSGETERAMAVIETTVDPAYEIASWYDHLTRFPFTAAPKDVIACRTQQLSAMRFLGDAFPKWFPNFGPGVMAAFLGSPVDASTGTTWFHPIDCPALVSMDLTFSLDNKWWRRIEAVTQAAIEAWGARVVIGHTDIGGNLDILASLRGSQPLLLDLYDAPREVERLAATITRLWLQYYGAYHDLIRATNRGTSCWAPLWSPGTMYMLQCDFSYMISPRMFERLVLPDLVACCDRLDHAFYHLDGKGQIPHLDLLLAIERLRGIQWIPGDGAPPPEEWLPLLKRIRDAGKLCQLYVTPEGALKIARELGSKGFVFCIGRASYVSPSEAQTCLEALQAEGFAG